MESLIVSELRRLPDLEASTILDAARDKDNNPALYADFDRKGLWDREIAARQALLDHAGTIVRRFHIKQQVEDEGGTIRTVTVPMFVHDTEAGSGYRFFTAVQSDAKASRHLVEYEVRQALGNLRRARDIALVLGISVTKIAAGEKVLSQILEGISKSQPIRKNQKKAA